MLMNEMKMVEPILNFTSNLKDTMNESALLSTVKKSKQEEKLYVLMGNKIKALRKEQKLTQNDLSLKLGVSSTYITLIEQGRRGGADDLLLRIEEIFNLKPSTLFKLRDRGNQENLQLAEVETEVEAKIELKPTTNHSAEQSDSIKIFVSALLSCDEDYVNQKIPQWLKEIQNDLFNQLTPYKLEDLKKHVSVVTRNWVNEAEDSNTFQDGTCQIQGCITEEDQKYFFSLQLNEFTLTLNLLHKDRRKVQYFEEWLGTCSINYSMQQMLPYAKTEEEISHYLWFNPQISIADMFRHYNKMRISTDKLLIKEPRLNWYIRELKNNLAT